MWRTPRRWSSFWQTTRRWRRSTTPPCRITRITPCTRRYFPNGGASIFTFNIKGGREEAFKFIDNLKVFSLLANVADVKSLVIHPASTTHSQLNDEELAEQQIYQNTIRLSIGTEHIDDIIADLEAGFAAVRGE